MMQAHRSECTTTRAEQYRAQFLLRSTLMCAGVLVGSAVIMWVAANWSLWSHTKRIVLVTVAFTVPLLFAGRQGRYHPKDWAKPWSLSSIADRKSTRLNSSHVAISYAVFCLKKKTYVTTLTNII